MQQRPGIQYGDLASSRAACGMLRGWFVVLVVISVVVGWEGRAQAQQSITLTENRVTRIQPFRQTRRWWINYEECVANDVFSFPLRVTDVGDRVEVWAGNEDCAANRGNTDRGQCWIVGDEDNPDDDITISVPVRTIIARRLNTTITPTNLPASVCDESNDASGEQFTFYFIMEDGGQSVGTHDTWAAADAEGTGFDMVGPAPPGRISVGVGESQLSIGMDDIGEESDRERFEGFCVPEGTLRPPSDVIDAGADAAATSALDGGTAAPVDCFTEAIRSGLRAPSAYSCGVTSEVSSSLRTSRLENNTTYAVAVAGQDSVGNAGVLSEIRCGTPVPLDDFYELYARNGGRGGGGFCSLQHTPQPSMTRAHIWVLGLLVAAFAGRRARSAA